ncbi:peptide ABC transporter substrate-binding protein [Parendozoicomonas haliclonae]|uniref:peptide ABC transporter substrate-binding protein n=1 Tax=Parendozoicomonas haliclonae TaxID=1960125 RepID=UPI0013FD4565|nr:peptide ABC transporter substrate-binding protein [Parendozoicomonas haliclonae]
MSLFSRPETLKTVFGTLSILCSLQIATTVHAVEPAALEGVELSDQQSLVRGNGIEPSSLDPQMIETKSDGNIAIDLFEGLVTQDLDGNVIPGAAESWSVSPDSKTFTFILRDGLKWSDGSPLTTADFVYSFRRLADPKTKAPFVWYLKNSAITNASEIADGKKAPETLGVLALDDKTLQISLDKPIPYFVKMLGHFSMAPVPQNLIEQYGSDWTKVGNLVTNGAYKLKSHEPEKSIVLERNSHYWNDSETVINEVTFVPVKDATNEFTLYTEDKIDMTSTIPLDEFRSLKRKYPEQIHISPQSSVYFYYFNTRKKPFDDVRVRKALSYTINRELIAKYIMRQGQVPAYGFTPEHMSGFIKPELGYELQTRKEREDEARRLLAEAGYGKSNPLEVTISLNDLHAHTKTALAIAQMWKKELGIKVKTRRVDFKELMASTKAGNYDIARFGWVADYNDPSSMLALWLGDNDYNFSGWKSAEFDQILNDAMVTQDKQKRERMYSLAEKTVIDEMPFAPIYTYVSNRLVKTHVGGYPPNNADNVLTRNLFIIKNES